MATKQIGDGFHFSISLGKALFNELLGAALPVEIKKGSFDLVQNARDIAHQLQVKEKVAGLLTDSNPEGALVKVKDRAADLWGQRREDVYQVINDLVRVEGEWKLELDRNGSELMYGQQAVGAEAHVKLTADGKATLLRENIELPFKFEKRIGAEAWLKEIRYDQGKEAIVADLKDVGLKLGENIVFRLANDLIHKLLEEQVTKVNPVPILPKSQLDGMLAPVAESPLKLQMDVETMVLEVNEDQIALKVRFGFTQLQITDKAGPDTSGERRA
jgi:hypothetical protein